MIRLRLDRVAERKSQQDFVISFTLPVELKEQATYLFMHTDEDFLVDIMPKEEDILVVRNDAEEALNSGNTVAVVKVDTMDDKLKQALKRLYAVMAKTADKHKITPEQYKKELKHKYKIDSLSDLNYECIDTIIERIENPEYVSGEFVQVVLDEYFLAHKK